MTFSKYFGIAKVSWQNGFVYRLNFVMWRLRNVIQLLTVYFLWLAVTGNPTQIFSYTQSTLLTYILGTSVIRAVVLSSRSIDAQGEIATGDLNNHLLKPFNYFLYWVARDISDKSLNIFFSIIEIALVILFLHPPISLQANPLLLIYFITAVILAATLYFIFSFIISMSTFWFYEQNGWPQRFLSFVLVESLAGGLFPLDILPKASADIVTKLPTAYFIYFPMQIYLGRLPSSEIVTGFSTMIFWIVSLYLLSQFLWRRGLRVYGAFGR